MREMWISINPKFFWNLFLEKNLLILNFIFFKNSFFSRFAEVKIKSSLKINISKMSQILLMTLFMVSISYSYAYNQSYLIDLWSSDNSWKVLDIDTPTADPSDVSQFWINLKNWKFFFMTKILLMTWWRHLVVSCTIVFSCTQMFLAI